MQKLLADAEAAIAAAAGAAMEAERAAADAGIAKEEAEHARRFALCLKTADMTTDGIGVPVAAHDSAASASAFCGFGLQ